jgi:hypothetical protein
MKEGRLTYRGSIPGPAETEDVSTGALNLASLKLSDLAIQPIMSTDRWLVLKTNGCA